MFHVLISKNQESKGPNSHHDLWLHTKQRGYSGLLSKPDEAMRRLFKMKLALPSDTHGTTRTRGRDGGEGRGDPEDASLPPMFHPSVRRPQQILTFRRPHRMHAWLARERAAERCASSALARFPRGSVLSFVNVYMVRENNIPRVEWFESIQPIRYVYVSL